MSQTSFFSSRAARAFALILLFGAALSIRLYDLTDLPLDFHPTRQLVSFIKARGMYYQTKPDGVSAQEVKAAVRFAKLKADVEPTVFENLVASTYRFTGEQVWVARMCRWSGILRPPENPVPCIHMGIPHRTADKERGFAQ